MQHQPSANWLEQVPPIGANCGEPGHVWRRCTTKPLPPHMQQRLAQEHQRCSGKHRGELQSWLRDSGASCHIHTTKMPCFICNRQLVGLSHALQGNMCLSMASATQALRCQVVICSLRRCCLCRAWRLACSQLEHERLLGLGMCLLVLAANCGGRGSSARCPIQRPALQGWRADA
jgi:hypothetical protein